LTTVNDTEKINHCTVTRVEGLTENEADINFIPLCVLVSKCMKQLQICQCSVVMEKKISDPYLVFPHL